MLFLSHPLSRREESYWASLPHVFSLKLSTYYCKEDRIAVNFRSLPGFGLNPHKKQKTGQSGDRIDMPFGIGMITFRSVVSFRSVIYLCFGAQILRSSNYILTMSQHIPYSQILNEHNREFSNKLCSIMTCKLFLTLTYGQRSALTSYLLNRSPTRNPKINNLAVRS